MAPRLTERPRTTEASLADLMDLIAPDANADAEGALSLLSQCGGDISSTIALLERKPEYDAMRRYLIRRGLMSTLGAAPHGGPCQ